VKALGEAFSHFEKQAATLSGERSCCQQAVNEHKLLGCWSASWTGLGEPYRKTSSPQTFSGLDKKARGVVA
jgi:hypothetical protein